MLKKITQENEVSQSPFIITRRCLQTLFSIVLLIIGLICWNCADSVYRERPLSWTKAAIITGFSGFFLLFPGVAKWFWGLVRVMIHDIFYEAARGIKTAESAAAKTKPTNPEKE